MKSILLFILLSGLLSTTKAADLLVPSQYVTIQSAIDAATNGDVIIVSQGTYFENIDFLGKSIIVTSNFHTSGDVLDISRTIIDGSMATDPDKGSVVSFITSENADAVLKGFTITGGTGTKTYNPADDAYFRTGGGIIINQSSPTIIYNIITDNVCVAEAGVTGAGGGGIRMGFGIPTIENNIIHRNTGGYAGGIMIAYCGGAVLKNNVISNNTATGSFNGGGGVYVDWEAITLENNTIVNNHSGDRGGAIISTGTSTIIINSIIYGNTSDNGFPQIYKRFGGNATMTYTNIEGGFDGIGDEEGVIDNNPDFDSDRTFILKPTSPCVDAGDATNIYNDIEDPASPGNALYPAFGTIRNDMGAFGGQGAEAILSVNDTVLQKKIINITYQNPYENNGLFITSKLAMTLDITVHSIDGKLLLKQPGHSIKSGLNIIPLKTDSMAIAVLHFSNGSTQTIKLIKQ